MSMLVEVAPLQVRSTVCLPCTLRPDAVSVIWTGVGVGVGVTVGVGVGVGVGLGVGVGVGIGGSLGVGDGPGVGVGPSPGAWISTEVGEPVLKKPTVAVVVTGGRSATNRKLYNVPQRIAFALEFCAKVSVFQLIESAV